MGIYRAYDAAGGHVAFVIGDYGQLEAHRTSVSRLHTKYSNRKSGFLTLIADPKVAGCGFRGKPSRRSNLMASRVLI